MFTDTVFSGKPALDFIERAAAALDLASRTPGQRAERLRTQSRPAVAAAKKVRAGQAPPA